PLFPSTTLFRSTNAWVCTNGDLTVGKVPRPLANTHKSQWLPSADVPDLGALFRGCTPSSDSGIRWIPLVVQSVTQPSLTCAACTGINDQATVCSKNASIAATTPTRRVLRYRSSLFAMPAPERFTNEEA